VATIASFSNQLDTAQLDVHVYHGDILILSNRLNQSVSAALAFSNRVAESQATLAREAEQMTDLTRHLATVESENQILDHRLMNVTRQAASMTGQIARLTDQVALTETNLNQARKDYLLLENRLRIDVAERVVAERKFNHLPELQAQIQRLKQNPARAISAEEILAGLDVEVKSNGTFHVIAPN